MLPDIITAYIAAYNAKDVDAMLATLSDDVRFENVSSGETTHVTEGKDAFAQLAHRGVTLFSERRQTVTNVIAGGDRVAVEIDYHAVVAIDLPNGWKAGDVVDLTGKSFFRLWDGLICDIVDIA